MTNNDNKPIDKMTFCLAVLTVLLVTIPMVFLADTMGPTIIETYNWVAGKFGLVFQWAAIGAMIVLGCLVFGPYGSVKLGDVDDVPEFSTLSWVAMLFSSGVGGGLLYWAGIEWAYYYTSPPMGVEPRSADALKWATSYGLFHWGFTAWCIYALPSIAMSYAFYIRKIPFLRLSVAVLGEKGATSILGRFVDLLFMLGLIGGAGTSLALTTPMVSAGLSSLTDLPRGNTMDIFVVIVCVTLFGVTVYLGLEKGIKKLADGNLFLSLIFLTYILIVGPTGFILAMGTESIGMMINNVFTMISWTDSIEKSGFVRDWTIFYWAWWIAFAPFVGIFVTRISRGRTIRQMGLAMCLFGSLGAWAFYIIFGNYALSLELNHILPVVDMVSKDVYTAIPAIISSLPLGSVALGIFTVVTIVYVATTYNAASYTLASAATRELHAGENPGRWHRLFWALILGIMPIGLMFIGGIKVVQSATLLAGLPLAITGFFMTRTLFRWLREDHK